MGYREWLDEQLAEEEYHARYGLETPHERDIREHDDRLEAMDRLAERGPHGLMHLAYIERPSDRERRAHFDENRVRALLRPRTGDVSPSPRVCPVEGNES